MKSNFSCQILLIGILLSNFARAENWPCWRGPRGDGTSIEQDVPINWDPAGALWKTELPGKGHASPIVWGNCVFTATGITATKERVLVCLDRNTGKVLCQQKLGWHYASPVCVGGLVFFINDDGRINVIKPGRQFECIATYELSEQCYASPAISEGRVYLRGFKHLFCIGSH